MPRTKTIDWPFTQNRLGINMLRLIRLLLAYPMLSLIVFGQSPQVPRSSITGQVVDTNNDHIEGAIVTLTFLPKGTIITEYTDNKGSFAFLGLTEGLYRISVKKSGFVDLNRDISLTRGDNHKLSFSLKVSGVTDTLAVISEPIGGVLPAFNGLAGLGDIQGTAIYAGKKNEVLILENLNANLAVGNTRQVFAKVPGINIWENDSSGFQIGVSSRGLDPNRSWEINSRQNGYDITADIFGYPEAYYTPPLEAVERVEVVRSASSLQYGAQFGGMINYVLKEAPPDRRLTFTTEQTGGANSLFNSHNRIGGTLGKWMYNGFYQHRQGEGWRDNAGFDGNTGFISLRCQPNERLKLGFELTRMEYLLQMAGGLTDQLFEQNPRLSVRPGNWFNLQWLVPAMKLEYNFDTNTRLNLTAFGLSGKRYSLFNSEPVAFPDGSLNPDRSDAMRTLFQDRFHNHGMEVRLLKNFNGPLSGSTLAAGVRYFKGKTVRQHGFGFAGREPIFAPSIPDFFRNLHFHNLNLAGFGEIILRLTPKLSITPGFRYDHLDSTTRGAPIVIPQERQRAIPLFGVGVSYHINDEMSLYVNRSQAYRPILFNDYWRPDSFTIVDPNIKDMTGNVYEFGWRGRRTNWFLFDIGGFYLKYHNRIGLLTIRNEQAQTTSFWTNVSDSRNVGLESFIEADLLRLARVDEKKGALSLFSSIAAISTRYLGGKVRGNRVEFAPGSIIRVGLTYRLSVASATLQFNRVGDQYTDADNTRFTVDGIQGLIPSYRLWDLSGSYNFKKLYVLRAGINNLADEHYFNRRGASYPGPGLIPADGRTYYLSFGIRY
jgi:Fe(3+) dicitrate transport protein